MPSVLGIGVQFAHTDAGRFSAFSKGEIMNSSTQTNKDLIQKAKWVADLMAADKVQPEQVTPELALAYMDVVQKKINLIQSQYLTRDDAKEAIQNAVFCLLN
jgi:hypothetical protein